MRAIIILLLLALNAYADKIHVMGQVSPGKFRVVIHSTTPAGSNSAGNTWASVLKAVKAKEIADCPATGNVCTGSVLKVGALPGEIEQTELDAIVAGTTMEIQAVLPTTSCSPAETVACANELADVAISSKQDALQVLYKRFGQEVN